MININLNKNKIKEKLERALKLYTFHTCKYFIISIQIIWIPYFFSCKFIFISREHEHELGQLEDDKL